MRLAYTTQDSVPRIGKGFTVNAAEKEIDEWFRSEHLKLQAQHGRYNVPKDAEDQLSEEYKRRHNVLIDQRHQAEKQAAREAKAADTRVCEACGTPLPIKRGRAPKRCEDCK